MRTIPLIRCLPKMSPSSSTSTGSQIAIWRQSLTWTRHDFSLDLRPLLTGKVFVWSPAFLLEPSSARYSSAPSITTVWSNYKTSYNDFFEVYITETVTLSPNTQMWCYHQFNFIIPPHVINRSFSLLVKIAFSWCSVMIIHNRVKIGGGLWGLDPHWKTDNPAANAREKS